MNGETDQELLRAIGAHPDEDAYRLAYAARLGERGDWRGRLIEAQCEQAALADPSSERALDLAEEEDALCEAHAEELQWELLEPFERAGLRALEPYGRLRRGFYDLLSLEGRGIDDETAIALSTVAIPPTVVALNLSENEIGMRGLRALAQSDFFAGLRSLNVSRNRAPDGLLGVVVEDGFPRLCDLEATENELSTRFLDALAGSTLLSRLTRLRLDRGDSEDAGLTRLLRSGRFGPMRDLGLPFCGDEEARILASAAWASGLTSLELMDDGRRISSRGIAAIAASPFLRKLEDLELGRQFIEAEGALALAQSSTLTGLRHLGLYGNWIGDRGAIALAESDNVRGLTSLDVTCCDIGPIGTRAILTSPRLMRLESLSLEGWDRGTTGVSPDPEEACFADDLARLVADCFDLPKLQILLLHAEIGPEGAAHLAHSPRLPADLVLDLTVASHTLGIPSRRPVKRIRKAELAELVCAPRS